MGWRTILCTAHCIELSSLEGLSGEGAQWEGRTGPFLT